MGDITAGRTWASGETATAARLNDAVNNATINALAVTTAALADGAVTTVKLVDTAVTTAKITDANVTAAKLAGDVGSNAWLTKTANYTAVAGDRILADVSGGAWTLTLPASPAARAMVTIADPTVSWSATTSLTVARNGSTIAGLSEDLVCDQGGVFFRMVYTGTTWRIYT
jgi:hypothetical protein